MKAITSILSILALSATLNAAEGDKKPEAGKDKPKLSPEEMFKRVDKDGNGSVSKEEYMAGPGKKDAAKGAERFGKLDKNADGSLSKEEFAAGATKKKKDA
ncbi:MAG: EF-hand domain-containing protein [Prosthecobacter sp.]|nr:EF-hand domain-containing protein [Prosthecobacter sp.]